MATPTVNVGRYALGERIAQGGMATVHLGRLVGSAGFSRTVAIKRLHPHLCTDPAFTSSFADEARLAARIRHPNVVTTLDVVSTDSELLIVMEYVDGEALSALLRHSDGKRVPLSIVVAIVSEMLHGLHSAHEAKSETGKPLEIVHRDVSPQNLLVGADGVSRLVDFGIARTTAKNRQTSTGENDLKGKLSYMAPEQLRRDTVSRKTDVFAAGVVLWELLTSKRLFASESEAATMEKILVGWVQPPSTHVPDLPQAVDDIALKALDADPNNRYATAREMAVALEDAVQRALGRDIAAWVEATAAESLAARRTLVARSEEQGTPRSTVPSFTGEVPTTPRRGEFTKPEKLTTPESLSGSLLEDAPPSTTAVTTIAQTVTQQSAAAIPPPRPPKSTAPEPITGPSLIILPSGETALPPMPLASLDPAIEPERTMTSWGEPITASHRLSAPPPSTPAPRSRVDRVAYTVFGLAALITLVVGLSWSRLTAPPPAPMRPFEGTTPRLTLNDPEVTPLQPQSPTTEPTAVLPPVPAPSPVAPPVTPLVTPAKKPPPRPLVITKPAKAPCLSKLDPATGKKIYQGDCD